MLNRRTPARRRRVLATVAVAAALVAVVTACDPTSGGTTTSAAKATTTTVPGAPLSSSAPCGRTTAKPKTYDHVVVMVEENRTWSGGRTAAVGPGFNGGKMPFLAGLATKCAWYADWVETNIDDNSLNQYIGMTSGVLNTSTVNDCVPSDTCNSTDNNIFRQVRTAGGTARTFVDGATQPCSEGTNKAKHIPALYYRGGNDAAACTAEVRPWSEFDPTHLPTFAFLVPDQCHDGHDCGDDVVDAFAKTTLTAILDGADYKAGKTLVVIVYDEDRPVPNLLIAPTAKAGSITSVVGSHAGMLKTIEQALGLPVMKQGQLPSATSLRTSANL